MAVMTMKNLKGGMCRWPVGDPKDSDFHFCGKPSDAGYSYCCAHAEQAHSTGSRVKKKVA